MAFTPRQLPLKVGLRGCGVLWAVCLVRERRELSWKGWRRLRVLQHTRHRLRSLLTNL